jgi:hypothetical protein
VWNHLGSLNHTPPQGMMHTKRIHLNRTSDEMLLGNGTNVCTGSLFRRTAEYVFVRNSQRCFWLKYTLTGTNCPRISRTCQSYGETLCSGCRRFQVECKAHASHQRYGDDQDTQVKGPNCDKTRSSIHQVRRCWWQVYPGRRAPSESRRG